MNRIDGIIFVWGSELLLAGVLLLAYAVIRFTPHFQKTSYLAVISSGCAILNPFVSHAFLTLLGVRTVWRLYFPSTYVVLAIAVISGHIALRRIRQSPAPLGGRALAWVGLVAGYASLAGGLLYLLLYTFAWSAGAPKG
jgi:hypothetical protein